MPLTAAQRAFGRDNPFLAVVTTSRLDRFPSSTVGSADAGGGGGGRIERPAAAWLPVDLYPSRRGEGRTLAHIEPEKVDARGG
jgi:hypothetical protein